MSLNVNKSFIYVFHCELRQEINNPKIALNLCTLIIYGARKKKQPAAAATVTTQRQCILQCKQ